MRHLARHLKELDPGAAEEFLRKADEALQRSALVRKAVVNHEELNVELVEEQVRE